MTTLYQYPRLSHVSLFHFFLDIIPEDIAVQTIFGFKITF